jgi:phosphatidylglycerophosphatase A
VSLKNKLSLLVATWFYTGLIPPFILKGMAGTYGSFFSIPFVWATLWLSSNVSPFIYPLVSLIIYDIGKWSVPRAEIILGPRKDWQGNKKVRDQNEIVIDETLGMLITCFLLQPVHHILTTYFHLPETHLSLWLLLLIGFAYFRVFDIIKVPPTDYFDEKMESAAGVMLDDVMAGIYAFISLQLTLIILSWLKLF